MFKIKKEMLNSVNFLLNHNYVPMIHRLEIENISEKVLENLSLKIYVEPEFSRTFVMPIGTLHPGESIDLDSINMKLISEYLYNLNESTRAQMFFEIYMVDEKIYDEILDINLEAFNQWLGINIMPETIISFSTPNHPRISELIVKASDYLKKWGYTPSFTGYMSGNQNNVKIQMAAIYAALQETNIIYNIPPASYEVVGQKIRLPHTVLELKQGTCLDLAMLYISCLEAIGLHPLLIIIQGHAYVGCWLEETTFSDVVIDDVSAIEKRIVEGLEEIILVEATDFVSGSGINFDRAIKHGKDHLLNPEIFYLAIDIQRGRGSGILPIPLKIDEKIVIEREKNNEITTKPKELVINNIGVVEDTKIDKQKLWERKLLDFSLRNSLLNFKITKNSLRIMSHNLAHLEDKLVDGKDLHILEAPREWNVSLKSSKIFEIETSQDLIKTIAESEFKSNRIRTYLDEEELIKNLKSVYRASKMSLEENGSNTLFLALGFLRWFENDISELPRYAPLVLMPIEIVKSSRNRGYVIRSRQEETQINITLLEYLRQMHDVKIGGLDPLPNDEHGIDLPLIFNTIRQAIMNKNRWNVLDDFSFIGLFSFGQFVMWNDLRNRGDEIKKSKIVSSLIEGYRNFEIENKEIIIEDLAIPLNADSSQLKAIIKAMNGESFILHGAPGTGKSQTITNMISTALYQGKSVLFVAEKMAALNVVENRLDKIGLGPFCLELHSNKTNKTTVLKQLEKVLETSKYKSPEEFEKIRLEILNTKNYIKNIFDSLHEKKENGLSIYEKIEGYIKIKQYKDLIEIKKSDFEISKEILKNKNELIKSFKINIEEIGNYSEHPLSIFKSLDYSLEIKNELEEKLLDLLEKNQEYLELLNELNIDNIDVLEKMIKIFRNVNSKEKILDKLIIVDDFEFNLNKVNDLVELLERYNEIKERILVSFDKSVLLLDINKFLIEWKKSELSWFLGKIFKQNSLLKEINIHSKIKVNKSNILNVIDELVKLEELKKEIGETNIFVLNILGNLFEYEKTNIKLLKDSIEVSLELRNNINEFYGSVNEINLNKVKLMKENYIKFEKLELFLTKYMKLKKDFDLEIDDKNIFNLFELIKNAKNNIQLFKEIVGYNQKRKLLIENDLENVIISYEKNKINKENILEAYLSNLYYNLAVKEISENKELREFRRIEFEEVIKKYEELIVNYQELTMQELVAKLSMKIPNTESSIINNSEMGILKRAIKSGGRMMSIRQLFNQIPNLLRRLCPCMLMSPMSIAQYIDPKFPKFDLIIFDEASQIPTHSAIGAMARGENVIIVGDPKQMPPTNFFKNNKIDEDNIDIEDLESLLDDCLAITLPEEHLKWHYRSKHESLISFSNKMYYENKLLTFPSPDDLVSNVKFIKVEGYYDKGKSKQNKKEAEAIVKEIIRRLSDEKLRNDSIGVVTFSSVQQMLIEDMLFNELYKHPELEKVANDLNEPIFIKNLENVQGDERDVILFSIGYGADKDGKVSMNFGPLNREGGWRRLNVAISRSRKEMIIYSTLLPEQIDLNRTKSEGVKGLKMFLDFAIRGKNIQGSKENSSLNKDELITELSRKLEKKGYLSKSNVGSSGYKIDLALLNPKNNKKYIMGLLFDGYGYLNSETIRDRFILQPTILKLLGWQIYNVWSVEYIENPEKVIDAIIEKINNILEGNQSQNFDLLKAKKISELQMDKLENLENVSNKIMYKSYNICKLGESSDFYSVETQLNIKENIFEIVEQEGPISKKNLIKKVIACWGINRSGSQVEQIISLLLRQLEFKKTEENDVEFLWPNSLEIKPLKQYRVEDEQGNKRNIEDISKYEIIPAIIEILEVQIAIDKKDLVREVAKKFGFTRTGSSIDKILNSTIVFGIEKNILKEENEKILMF
ncbi:DUF3320 domain-containing protein [Streptobacillus canis]|uniref:DUF3320 domain-containing protein n=1 Tax=Streptobacillus canis TaxID=2678686 RepID=UPI0012E1580F|nr:DUF3320 domain-containing protein [Streptobacillus canis]